MIAKLTLMSTGNPIHPMQIKGERVGYMRDMPQIGHAMILWTHVAEGSRYMRTTPVKQITDRTVVTENSVYQLDVLPVHFESEKMDFSKAVNGAITEK